MRETVTRCMLSCFNNKLADVKVIIYGRVYNICYNFRGRITSKRSRVVSYEVVNLKYLSLITDRKSQDLHRSDELPRED